MTRHKVLGELAFLCLPVTVAILLLLRRDDWNGGDIALYTSAIIWITRTLVGLSPRAPESDTAGEGPERSE